MLRATVRFTIAQHESQGIIIITRGISDCSNLVWTGVLRGRWDPVLRRESITMLAPRDIPDLGMDAICKKSNHFNGNVLINICTSVENGGPSAAWTILEGLGSSCSCITYMHPVLGTSLIKRFSDFI